MVGKVLFVVLAFCASQGYGLTEVTLEDRNIHMIRHEHVGTTIAIPKPLFDTLRSCHLTYPNGRTFEAFPQNNIPDANVYFNNAQQPFTSCSIGFRNVGPGFSGTYELVSVVVSSINNAVTMTKQRFIIRITEPEF